MEELKQICIKKLETLRRLKEKQRILEPRSWSPGWAA